MMKKRVLSMLLCFVLIIGLVPITAWAVEDVEATNPGWDGTVGRWTAYEGAGDYWLELWDGDTCVAEIKYAGNRTSYNFGYYMEEHGTSDQYYYLLAPARNAEVFPMGHTWSYRTTYIANPKIAAVDREMEAGEIYQFAVTGTHALDQQLRWSVSGANSSETVISDTGLMRVGSDETAATFTVTATSMADETKSGSVKILMNLADVAIDEVNFPDGAFRTYVSTNYDTNKDGMLQSSEILNVTEMDVSRKGLTSLQGIAYFTELTKLNCNINELTTLDVSKNTKLTRLECNNNGEELNLNITNNIALTYLDFSYNYSSDLDVSHNVNLTYLDCFSNRLGTLDVSNNTKLIDLNCGSNKLRALDVSNNRELIELSCSYNELVALNLEHNTKLETLRCADNDFIMAIGNRTEIPLDILDDSFDVSRTSNWTGGTPEGNILLLTDDDLTYDYDCGNGMTVQFRLNFFNAIPNIPYTVHFEANGATGTMEDVEASGLFRLPHCKFTPPENMQFKGWSKEPFGDVITEKSIEEIQDVTLYAIWELPIVKEVFPDDNFRAYISEQLDTDQDGTMVPRELRAVTSINVSNKGIETLEGISYFPMLTSLYCSNNNLKELDLSKNMAVAALYCDGNQLTVLDIRNHEDLTYVNCESNSLTSLDVTGTGIYGNLRGDNNIYVVTMGVDAPCTFDLTTLPGNFDVTKASNWTGGTVSGTTLSFERFPAKVTYTYDCGNRNQVTFTLQFTTGCKLADYTIVLSEGKAYNKYGPKKDLSGLGITASGNETDGYTYKFHNLNFNTTEARAMEIEDKNVTIELSGDNYIAGGKSDGSDTYGIYFTAWEMDVTFTGTGSLTVIGNDTSGDESWSYGMRGYGNCTVNSGTIRAYGGTADYSIGVGFQNFTMNDGTFTATSDDGMDGSYAINCSSVLIQNGVVIATAGAAAPNNVSCGINGGSSLRITGGMVQATAIKGTGSIACALLADFEYEITGGVVILKGATTIARSFVFDYAKAHTQIDGKNVMMVTAGTAMDGSNAAEVNGWIGDGGDDVSSYKYMRLEERKETIKPGDVNLDGLVNAQDALAVLEHAANIRPITGDMEKKAADITGDGMINAADALYILEIAAGIRTQ